MNTIAHPVQTVHAVTTTPSGDRIYTVITPANRFDTVHPTEQFDSAQEVFAVYPEFEPEPEPPAPPVNIDALRAQLWQSFDTYARKQTDDNSRVSISLIATNPASTEQQLARATEWGQWWASLWQVYAVKRAALIDTLAMPETDFEAEVGAAPYNIWEIAE